MDDFLTAMNRRLDDPASVSDKQLSRLQSQFDNAMENASTIFGDHAFRKWPENNDTLYPINRALFDVWSVKLSELPPTQTTKDAQKIAKRTRKLMTNDDEFIAAISTGTSSPQRVILRFKRVADLLSMSS